jgi:hypothetical protein
MRKVPGADYGDALSARPPGEVLKVAVPAAGTRKLRVDMEIRVKTHGLNYRE